MAWTDEARQRSIEVRRLKALMKRRLKLRNAKRPQVSQQAIAGDLMAVLRQQRHQIPGDWLTPNLDKVKNLATSWRPNVRCHANDIKAGPGAQELMDRTYGPFTTVVGFYSPAQRVIVLSDAIRKKLAHVHPSYVNQSFDVRDEKLWVGQAIEAVFHELVHSMAPADVDADKVQDSYMRTLNSPGLAAMEEGVTELYADHNWPEFAERLQLFKDRPELRGTHKKYPVYEEFTDGISYLLQESGMDVGSDEFESTLEHLALGVLPSQRAFYVAHMLATTQNPKVSGMLEADVAGAIEKTFATLMMNPAAYQGSNGHFELLFEGMLEAQRKYREKHPVPRLKFNGPVQFDDSNQQETVKR
jgi:hypothetical protein